MKKGQQHKTIMPIFTNLNEEITKTGKTKLKDENIALQSK